MFLTLFYVCIQLFTLLETCLLCLLDIQQLCPANILDLKADQQLFTCGIDGEEWCRTERTGAGAVQELVQEW